VLKNVTTMSQVTLLDEVSRWNQETCQQELKTVLPKLVISFPDFLHKFISLVVKVFASLLEEISKQIGGLSSQNTELHVFLRNILKMMVQTLESLSGCVRHVCSFEESVSFDSIRSLPSCILRVLKDTFQHFMQRILFSVNFSMML
uniref:Uncharacterized protein n=1 Tax=Cyprinus carpio TaxID=7962 RepID=A0A8C2FGL0_CYPCA